MIYYLKSLFSKKEQDFTNFICVDFDLSGIVDLKHFFLETSDHQVTF